MAHSDFWLWLNNHLLQAGMNISYHQTMADRMSYRETGANIAVVVCVVTSIMVAALGKTKKSSVLWAGGIGIIGLIILLIPFPTWRCNYQVWQRQWSEVQFQLKDMESIFLAARNKGEFPIYLQEEKRAVDHKIAQIQSEEPKPDSELREECWGNQLERTYGRGLRTTKDVEEYFKKEGIKPPADQPLRPVPSTSKTQEITVNVKQPLHTRGP